MIIKKTTTSTVLDFEKEIEKKSKIQRIKKNQMMKNLDPIKKKQREKNTVKPSDNDSNLCFNLSSKELKKSCRNKDNCRRQQISTTNE